MVEKTIYVRAKPESIKLTESYFFEKKLSRNPFTGPDQRQPMGKIEIIMPYDGDQYFTRQAYNDVKKQLNIKMPYHNLEAQFGYLAFINYDGTDLKDILGLNHSYGSFPLSIPIIGQGITSIEQLYSDTLTSKMTYDYAPKWPDAIPIDILIELWDEETLHWSGNEKSEEDQQLVHVAEEITKQINFRPNLLIKSQLLIDLPSHIVQEGARLRLTQISLKWPTHTSSYGLHLQIGTSSTEENCVMYNPQTRSLEWGNIPMEIDHQSSSADVKTTFCTDWMNLSIDYPGELYQQSCIEGQAEIEISGLLLSGIQVRLFNGIGERMTEAQPKVVSYVNIKFQLFLNEAFASRKLSPYEHLYFDEVIPDPMRVADIKMAIVDRGFRIIQDKSLVTQPDIKHFINAKRSDGPDAMELSMIIEGTRQEAERETQVKGGQKFKSSTESGDLKVYIRGEMYGNSKYLIQEMNALQASLHERFERLRSRR